MSDRDTQDRVTRRRAIGVAEKRAQMLADGIPWPACECHRVPMYWHKTKSRFHCAVRHNERFKTPEGRAKNAARMRQKYANNPEYRAKIREYQSTQILRVRAGGMRFGYRVDPGRKQEIQKRLAALREDQARTRKEMADNGWIY